MSTRAVVLVVLILAVTIPVTGDVVMRLDGTSKSTFKVQANAASPLSLVNSSGSLHLSGGLIVDAGTVSFSGATVSGLGTLSTVDINGGTIDGTIIGGSSRAAGSFTSLNANNGLTVSAGTVNLGGATTSNLGTITGPITSTLSTGTAPFSVASATKCTNLHADQVDGVSLATGSQGGVAYFSGTGQVNSTSAGTAGYLLKSNGSGAPTWINLFSSYIYVGNGSNVPTGVLMSGDATLNSSGVLSLASGSVGAGNLTAMLAWQIPYGQISKGGEVANTITCVFQVRDAHNNNLSGVFLVSWNIDDSQNGAGETSQSVTVSYSNGSEWQQITANKKAWAYTDATGKLDIDVTHTGANTMYLMCSIGGKVSAATLTFT